MHATHFNLLSLIRNNSKGEGTMMISKGLIFSRVLKLKPFQCNWRVFHSSKLKEDKLSELFDIVYKSPNYRL